ncbi:YitT family protein [Halalkalibacter alkalisediminis]|uniref:YitT family protein n=1 Tax=Halalkalibacter alkalisediminis TaxID=935616 RepID=A0ABV6NGP0_9BACI|nr:YitT family protein [Halalkalibacter alkalisediminis]
MAERMKMVSLVILGLILTSFGLKFLAMHELTFGGTAGLATVLTFLGTWSWGVLFFLANVPFFWMSFKKLGKWFTISSFMSIIGISIIRDALDLIPFFSVPMWLATILAGLCIGFGVTLVLNNGSSLGGIHILALYLDQKWNINRGITIFLCDLLIVIFAGLLVGWGNALLSIFTIFVASTIIGRYKKSPIKEAIQGVYSEVSSRTANEA